MNLQVPITEMKEQGNWPLPWTSAMGLIPEIQLLGESVVGCELGVSYGFNLVYTLESCPNISKVYAIDPYTPYDDGPGGFVDQDTIDKVKALFKQNTARFGDKVCFLNLTSDESFNLIPDKSLDYIFIDGDHSYDSVKKDLAHYYSKVKPGGIFSGHDFSLPGVSRAVKEFRELKNITSNLLNCPNDVWYWYK
jgi:hypothetical protein